MVTRSGNPICRCLPNYVPKPDTITGCGRECERDPDCGRGDICQNYKCVPRPDPCDPTPCGPNTECNVNRLGNPVCTCLSGYSPQPDTITGCGKIEARTPPPDPCFPSPCGPNTRCDVNRLGNPVCKCIAGYVPMPDTITGCKEKPDPCNPNPCGPNAECIPTGSTATCKCPAGFQGDPFVSCKKGECEYDHECSHSLACFNFNCRDPCIGTCGQNALCEVRDHRPICSCQKGFRGDPLIACDKAVVIGGRHASPPRQEPRNTIVIGQQYSDSRPEGRTGGGSSVSVIGQRYQPQTDAPQTRHVVGSRYSDNGGSSSCGGSSSRCGGNSQIVEARSAPGRTFTVIGSSKRRRRSLGARKFLRLVSRH
eukprot:TRINITY_DN501_c0_g2_i4.p1 TRINITY_DN501_c0_g2~~TRINITY_DN501_c0_g2_i4.p1  ORF type:complete len:367 (-),score=92.21 TRINITY_DN501_c0_g2_i4:358-1458(-)